MNLQAVEDEHYVMEYDYCEVKYVNVMNYVDYVSEEYINKWMSLVEYDIEVIGLSGSTGTLAVMNKVHRKELPQALAARWITPTTW